MIQERVVVDENDEQRQPARQIDPEIAFPPNEISASRRTIHSNAIRSTPSRCPFRAPYHRIRLDLTPL
jgi:hypothetical protein